MRYTLRAPLLLVIHNEFVHVDILERSLRQLSLDLPGLTLTVILSLNSSLSLVTVLVMFDFNFSKSTNPSAKSWSNETAADLAFFPVEKYQG